MVPFLGYKSYLKTLVDFVRTYDPDFHARRIVVLENTALYFALGVLVAASGLLFSFLVIPLFEVVLAWCILAAYFEVDVMIWRKSKRLNWQSFERIPVSVAKTDGRRVVALGMYHATIFYLTGFVLAFLLFHVAF